MLFVENLLEDGTVPSSFCKSPHLYCCNNPINWVLLFSSLYNQENQEMEWVKNFPKVTQLVKCTTEVKG